MATQEKNQENKTLNYYHLSSDKEVGQVKTLTDKVTKAIFEDKNLHEEGEISKLDFKFATKAFKNAVFHLEGEYDKYADHLTQFDKAVYDAVCTLFSNEIYIQTTKQIYELTTFSKYEAKPGQTKKIHDSMKRLLRLYLTLDVKDGEIQTNPKSLKKHTKDIQSSHLVKNEHGAVVRRVEGLCLYGESVFVRLPNGREVYAYKISKEVFNNKGIGVAYLYADWAKQIASNPKEMYELPIRSTDNNIAIRNQLLTLKHHNNTEPYIRVSKLMENAGIELNKKHKQNTLKTIKTILKCGKEKGFIEDFGFEKKAQNIHYKLFIKKKNVNKKQLKKGGQNG